MRELSKKASPELLEKIKSGKVSLNKAYEILKGKSQIQETNIKEQSKIGKGINSDSFKLGVLFVLSKLEKGKKKSQIIKDKRISKLELNELKISEEDLKRISERFGIL